VRAISSQRDSLARSRRELRLVPSLRLTLPHGRLDITWALLVLVNIASIAAWPDRDTITFHVISICFALLYWLRVWPAAPLPWGMGIVLITTVTGIALNVLHDAGSDEEMLDVPLLATMFVAVVWHANRRIAADSERRLIGEKNARLLAAQRGFLQDASHHLRTPITIALTYAELLARDLQGQQERRDVQMVIGEMTRLRRLSDRLLIIAGSEDPEFLRREPVLLADFAVEAIERWRPTAERRWELGHLDAATVMADSERLGLAVDALLENAVKFTTAGDSVTLSADGDGDGTGMARLRVTDTGCGIAATELPHVFDRFRSGSGSRGRGPGGTGLGLALVRAVADAHGGAVEVRSVLGGGSVFEIVLPAAANIAPIL
jgi:signal transduction histidine kinase